MEIKKPKHILLANIKKAKEILKTQERLNLFPDYVKGIKEDIKKMETQLKEVN
tara:strand:- start:69 stop:227 length:159 start_codon:yes stop_codon:yes gene_type:complete